MRFEWEEIKNLSSHKTYRAKVFGGWLVSTESYLEGERKSESLVFIPDSKHEWEIDED